VPQQPDSSLNYFTVHPVFLLFSAILFPNSVETPFFTYGLLNGAVRTSDHTASIGNVINE
jgi:hypothetical protein